MPAPRVRTAFMGLHAALGLGLLVSTVQALLHEIGEHGGPDPHLAFVIALEAAGAVLFLIPRTLRIGGVALLLVLLGSFAVHVSRGELEVRLLIYAVAVWFVMVHGAAWGTRATGSRPAA